MPSNDEPEPSPSVTASLRRLFHDPHFRRGVADMSAFGPGIAAWGLVTGVAMVQSGLGVWLSLLMSLTVFAGTSQLTSLPLLAAGAPMWVIWATAFCVNLRFVIFSAQWRVYIGHLSRGRRVALGYFLADLNLLVFQKAWPDGEPAEGQVPYIIGGTWLFVIWHVSSVLGIAAAALVPVSWGLGFAGTLSMLGLAYGLLTSRMSQVAAVVAAAAAIAAFALPLKLNILVAIVAAVAAGLVMNQAQRAARRLREAA